MRKLVDADFRFEETDVFRIDGFERDAVLEALAAGEELPIAVLGGRVCCSGGLDAEAIAAALSEV